MEKETRWFENTNSLKLCKETLNLLSSAIDYIIQLVFFLGNSFGVKVWFGFVLWHINPCRLVHTKSSLEIYIKYIWFGLVWFGWVIWHIIHCRLFKAKSSLDIYIQYIRFGWVWFGLVLWHINHRRLFNTKSSLDIYIKYIWSGFVWLGYMAYYSL